MPCTLAVEKDRKDHRFWILSLSEWGLPGGSVAKNLPISAETQETWVSGFDPWVGKVLWRRKWQPTPVFLPGKSHGRRNIVGYSPWGLKESDTTGATSL